MFATNLMQIIYALFRVRYAHPQAKRARTNGFRDVIGQLVGFLSGGAMKKYKPDPEWRIRVDATRRGVIQTLTNIESGTVDTDDLKKLRNFCLFTLALMQMEGPKKWELAKLNAEIMSLSMGEKSSTK